jgi:hypothetical protein
MKKAHLFIALTATLVFGCSGVQVRDESILTQPIKSQGIGFDVLGSVESPEVRASEFHILGPVEIPAEPVVKEEPVQIQIFGPVEIPTKPVVKEEQVQIQTLGPVEAPETAPITKPFKYSKNIQKKGDKIILIPWKGLRISKINQLLGVQTSQYRKYLHRASNGNYFVREGVPIEINFQPATMASKKTEKTAAKSTISSKTSLQHSRKVVWEYASDVQIRDSKITGIYTIIPEKGMKISQINAILGVRASDYKNCWINNKAANGNYFVREGVPIIIPFEIEESLPNLRHKTSRSPPGATGLGKTPERR